MVSLCACRASAQRAFDQHIGIWQVKGTSFARQSVSTADLIARSWQLCDTCATRGWQLTQAMRRASRLRAGKVSGFTAISSRRP